MQNAKCGLRRSGISCLGFRCFAFCVLIVSLLSPDFARACPFCVAVKPTLAQQCESATIAFLGECSSVKNDARDTDVGFAIRRVLTGEKLLAGRSAIRIKLIENIKPGTLALLLGSGESGSALENLKWTSIPLTELSFAYIARLPETQASPLERLKYFAKFLESADPLIADDAFLEFGHAPYDQVLLAGNLLSAEKLRQWMTDPNVPAERKGFYGLALGLTANGKEREANLALLKKLADADVARGGDFRAGFDGVLGGYLIADGRRALDRIVERTIDWPNAPEGDLRHAQTALRFYYEFGPSAEHDAVAAAVEKLLDRPGTAAAAITDLARWRQWNALAKVTPLYDRQGFADSVTQRSVIGYLQKCPLPEAANALEKLRQRDPHGVATAEKTLEALGGSN